MVSSGGLFQVTINDPIGGSDWNPKDRFGNGIEIPDSERYRDISIDCFGSLRCFSIDPLRRSLSSPPLRSSVSINRLSRIRTRNDTGAFQ
jgi:hypothetical protein